MRRLALTVAALALVALSGCATSRCRPGPAARTPLRTVAVLDFDDSSLPRPLKDYGILGLTRPGGVGQHVSDAMATSLKKAGVAGVDRGENFVKGLRRAGVTLDKLKGLPPAKAAWLLGVDAVITGKVTEFRETWFVPFTRSDVAFEAKCIEGKTGKVVWSGRASAFNLVNMQADLAGQAADRLARWAKRLMPPAPPAPPKPVVKKRPAPKPRPAAPVVKPPEPKPAPPKPAAEEKPVAKPAEPVAKEPAKPAEKPAPPKPAPEEKPATKPAEPVVKEPTQPAGKPAPPKEAKPAPPQKSEPGRLPKPRKSSDEIIREFEKSVKEAK